MSETPLRLSCTGIAEPDAAQPSGGAATPCDVEAWLEHTDIVVGIDGPGGNGSAMRWAASEARLRAARLRIPMAYEATWPPEAFGGLAELPEPWRDGTRRRLPRPSP